MFAARGEDLKQGAAVGKIFQGVILHAGVSVPNSVVLKARLNMGDALKKAQAKGRTMIWASSAA
jgi:hypothetical protein